MIDFAGLHHVAHQCKRFRRERESTRGKARGEARHAQHAHRVLGERRRDMAQHVFAQIRRAAKRVDQLARLIFGDRVDRQVAPAQIVLQSDVCIRHEIKPVIARSGLAFGARECVLFTRLRVQEYGEILADGRVAQGNQVLRRGADDDVIAVLDGQAEQAIAHRAADEVGFHAIIIALARVGLALVPGRKNMKPTILVFAALALLGCAAPQEKPATVPVAAATTLYGELGGTAGITKVVDLFLARINGDARINTLFAKTDHNDLRRLVIEQLCEATGGPCKYTGRSMEEAHSGLNLTNADYSAFMGDLVAAMDEAKVPLAQQNKLIALLAPMKPQVVGQ